MSTTTTTPPPPPMKGAITGAWILNFDGGCEPRNPGGRMTQGWVADLDSYGIVTGQTSQAPYYVPTDTHHRNTNNNAEWFACGYGLLEMMKHTDLARPEVLIIRGDSKLVIEQLSGRWRCNVPLHEECRNRVLEYIDAIKPKTWRAEWIPREQNEQADALSRFAYFDATGAYPPERQRRSA